MFMPVGVFAGMRKLEELTVAGGNLNKLTKTTFNGLNKLKKLSLDHNNLTKLDRDLFKFQQNLEYLDISHNKFQKLEPYFFKVIFYAFSVFLPFFKMGHFKCIVGPQEAAVVEHFSQRSASDVG